MIRDRYKNLKFHHDRVNWLAPGLTADTITRAFLGPTDYWAEEEFAGMRPHEIERTILFEGGRDQWNEDSPYGKPYYQHFLTLLRLLFPQTDITPTIADAVMFFCKGLGWKKILNLIGCQNAGKSAGAIRIVFVCMYIDPYFTAGYVANPFDNAAASTVWGDVEELWDELCSTFPCDENPDAPALFPKGKKYANKSLIFIPNQPKAARIDLKNVKHVGKYKGSKTRGKQTDRGVFFVIVDEINEIENMAFLTALENLSSQKAFFCITSQNFKDEEDMGGQITSPVGTYGGPSEFADLEIDRDFYWHSVKASVTLRFDGHRSPNILATGLGVPPTPEYFDVFAMEDQRVLYPYLIDMGDLLRLRESGGGEQSLAYFSQARSFPIRGSEVNVVLSKPKLSASRHKDPHFQMIKITGSVGFLDPAFGGRDSAVWGGAHFGLAAVKDGEGNIYELELLQFNDYMKKLKLTQKAILDDHWMGRLQKLGVSLSSFTPGKDFSFEQQLAVQSLELNREAGIPSANFGYDFSMRPDIVSAINQILGFEAVAFNYNMKPEGHFLENTKQETEEVCKDRVAELALLTADLFLTKQIRGGGFIEAATTQLTRTIYEMVGQKYVVEKKAEYKARWQQKSPDERDVLMGLAGMAHKRGFRLSKGETGSKGGDLWLQLSDRNVGKKRIKPLVQ